MKLLIPEDFQNSKLVGVLCKADSFDFIFVGKLAEQLRTQQTYNAGLSCFLNKK